MIVRSNVRQRHVLTGGQIAAILGLEDFLQKHGLIICCPRCAEEGYPFMDTDNDPSLSEWKIDCRCRERRIKTEDVPRPLDADNDLIRMADEILAPISLAIRCGQPGCVRHKLVFERTSTTTVFRCRCAKTKLPSPHKTVH